MIGTTKVNTKTHCRYCGEELSYDEVRDCKVCLVCHPGKPDQPAKPKPEKPKFLDERMTEERVREIVRDELENWHIQRPPATKEETATLTAAGALRQIDNSSNDITSAMNSIADEYLAKNNPKETWRQKAKRMGISLMQKTGGVRKKVDVLADIERVESGLQEELRTEEQAGSGRSE